MNIRTIYLLPLLAALGGWSLKATAEIQSVAINDYLAIPPFLDLTPSGGGFPSFLLAVSRDNQMFFKAYSDYGDLDGDNIPETTYKQSFEYYGLFNPDLCYTYDVDAFDSPIDSTFKVGAFKPSSFSGTNSDGSYNHVCATGWSGNFMNWATATRLDIVQKVIYGGSRYVDTTSDTYLIGAWTPPDNHSFVKYVKGANIIGAATPVLDSNGDVPEELTLCRTSLQIVSGASGRTASDGSDPPPMVRIAVGDFRQWDLHGRPCWRGVSEADRGFDQRRSFDTSGNVMKDPMTGEDIIVTGSARPDDFDYEPSAASPLLTDIVRPANLRPPAASSLPVRSLEDIRNTAFMLPVQVCVNSYINAGNKENCRVYGTTAQKPAGMLQRYGEPGLMKIGMIATSYRAALHGGILRARVVDIEKHGVEDSSGNVTAPEVNQTTGVFNLEDDASDFDSTSLAEYQRKLGAGRIISFLDDIRLVYREQISRDFGGHGSDITLDHAVSALNYIDLTLPGLEDCGFTGRRIEERCGSWGNPYAELIYEAVNYLAGGSVTENFLGEHWTAAERSRIWGRLADMTWGHYRPGHAPDAVLPWDDNNDLLPTGSDTDIACSPMNILAINSSVISHDADNIPADKVINSSSMTMWGEGVITAKTRDIGTEEMTLVGQKFILPDSTPGAEFNVCSYLELTDLSTIRGLCPNAPAMQGSFLTAGAAWYAHTTDLRTDLAGKQTINFLGVEMRPNVPQIIIPLASGDNAQTILLQPGYTRRVLGRANRVRLNSGQQINHHNGRLTQFQPIYPPRWTKPGCKYEGVYLVGWEDGLSGTDFDVDLIGYLDFKVLIPGSGCTFQGNSTMVEIGTQISTGSQGTNQILFGFTVAGTTQDGFHAYSGTYGRPGTVRTIIANSTTPRPTPDPPLPPNEMGPYVYLDDGAMAWPEVDKEDRTGSSEPNEVPSCGTKVNHYNPTSNTPHSSPSVLEDLIRPNGTAASNSTAGCAHNTRRVSHLFIPGSGTSPSILRSPLYYASKYGGFKDSNNNDKPDLEVEWDALDNRTGLAGADGEPDNYFLVTDPTVLDNALERALVQGGVSQRTASGTAAALVANEREGLGAVFQALFEPSFEDEGTPSRSTTWFGTLHALFIDSHGLLREDSNGNDTLDDYTVDKVIVLKYNPAEGETEARVFDSSDAASYDPSGSTTKSISRIGTIWNAREWLNDSKFGVQRIYDDNKEDSGNNGYRRHITTWIDGGIIGGSKNGKIEASEIVSVHQSSFISPKPAALKNYFDVATDNEIRDIVRFVRGLVNLNSFKRKDDPSTLGVNEGLRNRQVEYDGTTGLENMRLGDIINSSPAAVTAPAEAYDLLAGESSYRNFRQRWDDRRQMVYVGGNDGMLHAFNAGFYNREDKAVKKSNRLDTANEHELGKEMWAYIPRTLLPHLKWLIEPEYPHSYYVDGSPRVFDAEVYTGTNYSRTDRPDGWGTFLIVGMRLGGGTSARHIVIDSENDGIGASDSDPSDDIKALSSFIVMDITDPEDPPRVLAELSPPGMEYTTARPAVVPVGSPGSRKWFLVLGNGPDTLATGEKELPTPTPSPGSTLPPARLYFYDLAKLAKDGIKYNDDPAIVLELPSQTEGHFVGGISVADFDLDLSAEAIYVTTAGSNTQGSVVRVVMNENASHTSWTTHLLLNAGKPFISEPTLARDEDGNRWVYVGSGRLFVESDNNDSSEQTLYGLIDKQLSDTTSVSASSLYNVTDVRSFTNGGVDLDGGEIDTTFEEFRDTVAAAGGWRRNYHDPAGPSQRTVNPSTLLGEVLFNTAYTPPAAATSTAAGCGVSSLGESVVIGIDFRSGIPHPSGVFGTTNCSLSVCTTDNVKEALGEKTLGQGLSSLPSLHLGNPEQNQPGQITVVVQQSTGEVQAVQANTVNAGGAVNIDWREYIQ